MSPFGPLLHVTWGRSACRSSGRRSWAYPPRSRCRCSPRCRPRCGAGSIVAHLVGGGAPLVERRVAVRVVPKAEVDHDAVGGRGAAGKLRIAQQPAGQRADPDVEWVFGIEGRRLPTRRLTSSSKPKPIGWSWCASRAARTDACRSRAPSRGSAFDAIGVLRSEVAVEHLIWLLICALEMFCSSVL